MYNYNKFATVSYRKENKSAQYFPKDVLKLTSKREDETDDQYFRRCVLDKAQMQPKGGIVEPPIGELDSILESIPYEGL